MIMMVREIVFWHPRQADGGEPDTDTDISSDSSDGERSDQRAPTLSSKLLQAVDGDKGSPRVAFEDLGAYVRIIPGSWECSFSPDEGKVQAAFAIPPVQCSTSRVSNGRR